MARGRFRDKIRRMRLLAALRLMRCTTRAAAYAVAPVMPKTAMKTATKTAMHFARATLVALLLLCSPAASAVRAQAGWPPREPLWPAGAPGAVGSDTLDTPSIMAFPASASAASGAAVVIFPGGGYTHLATEKEGTKIAMWLNTIGVSAFVVTYRLGARYHHPAMLYDAQRAVRTVRARAREWGVDTTRVGVLGFSAGGHLAATIITHPNDGIDKASLGRDAIDRQRARPDFAVLMYPVITMRDPFVHRGSRQYLLGDAPSAMMIDSLSNELQVSATTPPTFLVHATDDAVVPVENSLLFYAALQAAKVPAELHIFQKGGHGFGMAPNDPALAMWMPLCAAWMRSRGLLEPVSAPSK
jgi:acetyl esterase/lipase